MLAFTWNALPSPSWCSKAGSDALAGPLEVETACREQNTRWMVGRNQLETRARHPTRLPQRTRDQGARLLSAARGRRGILASCISTTIRALSAIRETSRWQVAERATGVWSNDKAV